MTPIPDSSHATPRGPARSSRQNNKRKNQRSLRAGPGVSLGASLAAMLWLGSGAAMAAAGTCTDDFAGGTPPAVTNRMMAEHTQFLCNGFYAVGYSDETRTPLWSAEKLTPQQVRDGEDGRRPDSEAFHEDERVPDGYRSKLADYKGSVKHGYDRGHMTPSADGATPEDRASTFVLSNVVPQSSRLNRGVWSAIEKQVREIAARMGPIYVVTGPAFVGKTFDWLGQDRVYVPTSTWKAVYIPSLHGTGVYVCSNTATPNCTVASVSQLTQASSIDPFPTLNEAEKNNRLALPKPVHTSQ